MIRFIFSFAVFLAIVNSSQTQQVQVIGSFGNVYTWKHDGYSWVLHNAYGQQVQANIAYPPPSQSYYLPAPTWSYSDRIAELSARHYGGLGGGGFGYRRGSLFTAPVFAMGYRIGGLSSRNR